MYEADASILQLQKAECRYLSVIRSFKDDVASVIVAIHELFLARKHHYACARAAAADIAAYWSGHPEPATPDEEEHYDIEDEIEARTHAIIGQARREGYSSILDRAENLLSLARESEIPAFISAAEQCRDKHQEKFECIMRELKDGMGSPDQSVREEARSARDMMDQGVYDMVFLMEVVRMDYEFHNRIGVVPDLENWTWEEAFKTLRPSVSVNDHDGE